MDMQLVEYKKSRKVYSSYQYIHNLLDYVSHLDLGTDFLYGGDYVRVYPRTLLQALSRCSIFTQSTFKYKRDEVDPYRRYGGRFNGRTFGKGRFILVIDRQDDAYKTTSNPLDYKILLGNIHSEPQLWEKINNV